MMKKIKAQPIRKIDGLLRAIDTGKTKEYWDSQDAKKISKNGIRYKKGGKKKNDKETM